jgi:hypothetical protein
MLVIFSASYLGGMLAGTEIRAASFKVRPSQFPWSNTPQNVEDALDWLAVQQRLIAYDYSPEQVRELYKLPRANAGGQLAAFVPEVSDNIEMSQLGTHPEPRRWIPARFDFRAPFDIGAPTKKDAPRNKDGAK